MKRPSLIKTNARYRGPTESEKYINMMQEIIHDLRLLCHIVDGNEKDPLSVGHREAIEGNLHYYVTGEADKVMIDVPTATNLSDQQMAFQKLNPANYEAEGGGQSIKSRINSLDAEIEFILRNL